MLGATLAAEDASQAVVAVGRAAATSAGFPIMVAAAAPAAAEGCRGVVPVAAGAEAV